MNLLPFGPFLFSVSLTLFGRPFHPELARTADWTADSLGQAVAGMALLAALGILMTIVGFKVFGKPAAD